MLLGEASDGWAVSGRPVGQAVCACPLGRAAGCAEARGSRAARQGCRDSDAEAPWTREEHTRTLGPTPS